MLEKSRNAVFFHRFVCRVSPKVGLLKRRVRRYVLRGDIKNCTPLWRKAHFQVKMYKKRQVRSIFRSYDVAKLHAAVAKSTFPSQNVKKLSCSEHFLTFYCGKIAEKLYAAAPKCTFGSENVKKLSCSEHFLTFYCGKIAEKLYAAVPKCTFGSENVKKLSCSEHFFDVLMSKN